MLLPPSLPLSTAPVGAIVGGVVGTISILLFLCVSIVIVIIACGSRRTRRNMEEDPPHTTIAMGTAGVGMTTAAAYPLQPQQPPPPHPTKDQYPPQVDPEDLENPDFPTSQTAPLLAHTL